MSHQLLAIANEFDSYMQDRAQRLGYRVRTMPFDARAQLAGADSLALVEFHAARPVAPALTVPPQRLAPHGRGHFAAWADAPGGLVQMHRFGNATAGADASWPQDSDSIGARTFAERFFAEPPAGLLSTAECMACLAWLAGGPPHAPVVTAAARLPAVRELVLMRRLPGRGVAG